MESRLYCLSLGAPQTLLLESGALLFKPPPFSFVRTNYLAVPTILLDPGSQPRNVTVSQRTH